MIKHVEVKVSKGRNYRATVVDGEKIYHHDAKKVCEAIEALRPRLAELWRIKPTCIRFHVVRNA